MTDLKIDKSLPIEQALVHISKKNMKRARKIYAQPSEKSLAVDNLHRTLFAEEYDFMGDEYLDATQRRKAVNPMQQSYQVQMNKKRKLLGFDEYRPAFSLEPATIDFCKRLCSDLTCYEIHHLTKFLNTLIGPLSAFEGQTEETIGEDYTQQNQ